MRDEAEELCYRSARDLVCAMTARELSAREVMLAHLAQIEAWNPAVNAIVTLCAEHALEEAAALDERLVNGEHAGPLHGLPVAHKDTHRTAGIRTTFGSPVFRDFVPEEDELIVERLHQAGVVTTGKTNVPEFAAGSHTFNTIFGATANPYDLSKSAGGSTGGGAAALACGMQPLADGSDMGGSLRNPASFCNVVGLRPTPGRVPGRHAADAFGTLSVEGVLARSADDLALALSAIAGDDGRSPLALGPDGSAFAAPLERDLSGLRVAFSSDLGGLAPADPEPSGAVNDAAALLAELGGRVDGACPDLSGADDSFRVFRAAQFDLAYGAIFDEHPELLKESIRWNVAAGRALRAEDLVRATAERSAVYRRIVSFFDDHDVLLVPTSQVLPFDLSLEYPEEVAGAPTTTYLDWMASCYLISVTSLPACSVPFAFSPGGLPIGVQLVGPPRGEVLLLQVAHALEQANPAGRRRPPWPGATASAGEG